MMNRRVRSFSLIIVISAVIGLCAWAALRFRAFKKVREANDVSHLVSAAADPELWSRAVEKVKETRSESEAVAIEIPPQLRHYSDRHWFLATQVAEVRKFNIQSCQDFVDLAAMIQRGELVMLPAVTADYILYGVGAKADDREFSRFEDDHNVGLYDKAELYDAYSRLESERSKLQTELSAFKTQLARLKKGDRAKRVELQKEISEREQELKANGDEKALLDQSYGQPQSREKLLRDYESLQTLAKNFGGRSFNLDDANDRQSMKVRMLSSLRPEGVKILEEIAKVYHGRFDRPLPVSSLVRPEQYQRVLNRVNRNAVLIDTPPHSTGLAFDIDYRYMSGAEQSFLMAELARMKDEGRIEVIRERNANYHVFAFIDGKRPGDDLITASLDEASVPVKEANHVTAKKKTSSKAKNRTSKSKVRRRR